MNTGDVSTFKSKKGTREYPFLNISYARQACKVCTYNLLWYTILLQNCQQVE